MIERGGSTGTRLGDASHRGRLAAEHGFTMVIALMVLTISSLLIAAAFVAAKGDIGNTQRDLDGKRAYYAARAGLSNFLYKVNKNTELWETCPSQATTQVPGGPTNVRFSYTSVPANGAPACNVANPVGTMIDFTTGSFRMKFTGTAGTPAVTRTIVAAFRRDSPLDYLWYSKYETLDPNTYADPGSHQDCAAAPPRRPAVRLRRDQLDHGRQAQRPDVHPGPVLDLRRAHLRPPGRHRRRPDDCAGASDSARPDHDLGLQQQRGAQR